MALSSTSPSPSPLNNDLEPALTESPRALLERCSDWIVKVATAYGSRQHLPREDVEDFVSWVILRMMANDYTLLRSCRRPDRPWSFLRTAIRNLLKDYRNCIWGKWRPSAEARRIGPTAVRLERLHLRDGLEVTAAIEVLRRNFDCRMTARQLEELAARLPRRHRRLPLKVDVDLLPSDARADHRLRNLELRTTWKSTRHVLGSALAQLEDDERDILRLHYQEGRSFARISRELSLNQRSLYTKRDRCLRRLRAAFRRQGLGWADVAPCLGWEDDNQGRAYHHGSAEPSPSGLSRSGQMPISL